MTGPVEVVQAEPVHIRHIKRVSSGGTSVLGVNFEPQDRKGVNGPRGFVSGRIERRLSEEGTFTLRFPNAVGEDGVLHRERFLLLTDPTYRAGDEWIEVYTGEGELRFVGTPTKWQLGRESLEVSGFDAVWLLKKIRETAAGFWWHAPRDAFEHYTRSWRSRLAVDFTEQAYGFSTSNQTSPDGKFRWRQAERLSDDWMRVRPTTANESGTGELRGLTPYGPNTDIYNRWRFETRIRNWAFPRGEAASRIRVGIQRDDDAVTAHYGFERFGNGVWNATTNSQSVRVEDKITTAPTNLAIEGDYRYVYFYVNEVLVAQLPVVFQVGPDAFVPRVWVESDTVDSNVSVDVDFLSFEVAEPFLMRSSTVKGDLRLAGLPPKGGLVGEYWTERPGVTSGNRFNPVSDSAVWWRRVDEQVNFPAMLPPVWQPPGGVVSGENFSVRWTGAIYLDLDNYDYAPRITNLYGSCRIWIGKTRGVERVVNEWTTSGVVDNTTSGTWLKAGSSSGSAPSGSSGVLAGQKSGWYPVVVEYGQGTGTGGLAFELLRSDWLSRWFSAGSPSWTEIVRRDGPVGWWRFSATSGTSETDESGNGRPLTYTGTVTLASTSGAIVRDPPIRAAVFGSGASASTASAPSVQSDNWALEAIFRTRSLPVDAVIVEATGGYGIRINNGAGSGTGSKLTIHMATIAWIDTGVTLTTNQDYHVVATRKNGQLSVFLDGKRVYGPTAVSNPAPTGFTCGTNQITLDEAAIYTKPFTPEMAAQHSRAIASLGETEFSPVGCYNARVRFDSHYEQLRALSDDFALQWTCEPMQLESGEFPGRVVPRVRVGRDTEFVLDDLGSTEVRSEGDAEGSVDALLVDAQGLSDVNGATQITKRGLLFSELTKGKLLVHSEHESVADISFPELAEQRAESLIALRANSWEEVNARPLRKRALVDSFPLTGALAKFAWEPGDGVRLRFDQVDVVDTSPRQIMGVAWNFTPDGLSAPEASFRQRPRNFRETLRRIIRPSALANRNYQGQLVKVQSRVAGWTGTTAGGPDSGADQYARIALPTDRSKIVKVEFVLFYKQASGSLSVTDAYGTTLLTGITKPGRWDITPYAARNTPATGVSPDYYYVATTSISGEILIYHLEATVLI